MFNPEDVPELLVTTGDDFERNYIEYEACGPVAATVDIVDLWATITLAQAESGCPFICYQDSINSKSSSLSC